MSERDEQDEQVVMAARIAWNRQLELMEVLNNRALAWAWFWTGFVLTTGWGALFAHSWLLLGLVLLGAYLAVLQYHKAAAVSRAIHQLRSARWRSGEPQ